MVHRHVNQESEVSAIHSTNSKNLASSCVGMSDRVVLTLAAPKYSAELHHLYSRNREAHKPWLYHGTTDSYFHKIASGRTLGLFIWRTIDDVLIGVINFNEPVMGGLKSAYLGYFIDSE